MPTASLQYTRMHILILTDRCWDHPEAGGTGVHLTGQIDHWLLWGHCVTVIAGGYEGSTTVERSPGLTTYRVGSRVSVFPRTVIRGIVGRIPDADVTLEIINGICWMTPIWLKGGSKHGRSVDTLKKGSGRRHSDMNGAVSPR